MIPKPARYPGTDSSAARSARRVLPVPPGPVRVSRRTSARSRRTSIWGSSSSRPTNRVGCVGSGARGHATYATAGTRSAGRRSPAGAAAPAYRGPTASARRGRAARRRRAAAPRARRLVGYLGLDRRVHQSGTTPRAPWAHQQARLGRGPARASRSRLDRDPSARHAARSTNACAPAAARRSPRSLPRASSPVCSGRSSPASRTTPTVAFARADLALTRGRAGGELEPADLVACQRRCPFWPWWPA
jgi:hypothetical protein